MLARLCDAGRSQFGSGLRTDLRLVVALLLLVVLVSHLLHVHTETFQRHNGHTQEGFILVIGVCGKCYSCSD